MSANIFRTDFNRDDYLVATYMVHARTNVRDAAWAIAVGQSVGNPEKRSVWETDELFEKHGCLIGGDEEGLTRSKTAAVTIAYPVANLSGDDGLAQILAHVQGGHLEIDRIAQCQLINLEIPPKVVAWFRGPKYGIRGIRAFVAGRDRPRPLLGAIVKPKTGIAPDTLLEIVKQLSDGGVDFIKEDEIMSNPPCCRLSERVPLISDWLSRHNARLIYAFSVTADPGSLLARARFVQDNGGNAIHFNWWAGLGAYRAVRDLDLNLFLFLQKSGSAILTDPRNPYQISERVLFDLAGMVGVDFAHAGMWSGYLNEDPVTLSGKLATLRGRGVMPSLSCGMHPGLVEATTELFGPDYMATAGGAIHAHPGGTLAGARAFRQAIDGTGGPEYDAAIAKWGCVTRVSDGERER